MEAYQRDFIRFALDTGVLKFGEFTLKSGRTSPYFFNAGLFNTGKGLSELANFYAAAIVASGVRFDMLFGPAYKGIPLVSAVALALYRDHGLDYPYAYNRKEAKDHGEGGVLVGAPLQGQALIIDDVITAGTAIREVMTLFDGTGASVAGVTVAIDRQEKGQGQLSAIQEVERDFGIGVISVIRLEHLITYLQSSGFGKELAAISDYRQRYGI